MKKYVSVRGIDLPFRRSRIPRLSGGYLLTRVAAALHALAALARYGAAYRLRRKDPDILTLEMPSGIERAQHADE
jgi:hypothetical protein